MTDKPENPPAFPCKEAMVSEFSREPYFEHHTGLSLRDYFAAKAMQAYVALEPLRQGLNAEMAYAQADEMLKARR